MLQNWPNWSAVTRVTWQATERDKIRVYMDKQRNGNKAEGLGPQTAFSASHQLWTPTGWTPQIKWTQATTNRLMLDAGFTMYDLNFRREPQSGFDVNDLPLFEISNSTTFAGTYSGTMDSWTKNYQVGMAATYVTGAHTFKAGFNHLWGNRTRIWPTPNDGNISQLRFNGGAPAQVVVRNTPIEESIEKLNADFGVFAQDGWTMNRLTLNMGARFDYFNAEVPALSAPASTWVAARDRAAVENVPNWKDWAVRVAATYDLFGNGKTALKANVGKYLASAALGFAELFNTLTAQSETRTWADLDGNRSRARRQRQPAAQRGARRHRELRSGRRHRSSRSCAEARIQLGVRRAGPARAVPACLGDCRLPPPHLRQPADHRQPESESRPSGRHLRSPRRSTRGCPTAAAIRSRCTR